MTDILIGILIAIFVLILIYVAKHPPQRKRRRRRRSPRGDVEYEGLPWMSSPKKRRHDDYKF